MLGGVAFMVRVGLLVGLVALLAPVWVSAGEAEVDRLRRENATLSARVAALEAENAELRVLAGLTDPTSPDQAPLAPVTARYDEGAGETTVETAPSRLDVVKGSRSRHWVTLRYQYPGHETKAPVAQVRFEVDTVASGSVYRGAKTLHLWVDGEAFECPVVGYRAAPATVSRAERTTSDEHVTAELPAAVLARIGSARQVRGELGATEFHLTPAQIVAFRAFQRRLDG
jgi:hypothetical protein